jgi:hypothetical protein
MTKKTIMELKRVIQERQRQKDRTEKDYKSAEEKVRKVEKQKE